MSLRVTQQAVGRTNLASIRQASDNLSIAQEQLATARRINRLSDAPLDAARAHRLRASTTRLDQYTRNLDQAQHEIEFTASTLQQVSDIFIEAGDICVRGADGSTDSAERETLAFAVEQLLGALQFNANAQYNGHYIFAGSANDTEPFVMEPADGPVASVTYQGNTQTVALGVGTRTQVETCEPGTDIFGQSGGDACAFDVLVELRDLLRNTEGLTDNDLSEALSNHVEQVRTAHNRVIDATSRFGWRSSQLEFTRTVVDNAMLANTEEVSTLEDADYTEAAIMLQRHEVALQTALAVAARMTNNSLLEYLK